tara:strand:+ start:359 stop:1009 length:651 start_codon:yes stop_codon:yes gene_type:complete
MLLLILDYGSGNVKSVYNALKLVIDKFESSYEIKISSLRDDINKCDALILPGVGSFKNCKKNIFQQKGLVDTLSENVLNRFKPFLGICVGMQLLADFGFENGKHKGLGWINGKVKLLNYKKHKDSQKFKIPHMGWNQIKLRWNDELFKNIDTNEQFYFVHSYYFDVKNQENLLAYTSYGIEIPAVIKKNNIYGLQFHPEKSGIVGQKILFNWLNHI